MMSGHIKITLAALLSSVAVSGTAYAQQPVTNRDIEHNFYVSGFVGAAFPGDASFSGVQNPPIGAPAGAGVIGAPAEIDVDFGTDVNFGGAVGYQLPFLLFGVFCPRIELEVNYFEAGVDSGSFNDGIQTFSGDLSNLSFFVNNLTDLIWKENQVLVPYIGGGLGLAIIDADIQYVGAAAPFAPLPAFEINEDDVGFATHNILGLAYLASDRLEVYAEGRYTRTYGIDFERRFVGGNTVDIFSADVSDTLDGFTATAGVRYRF